MKNKLLPALMLALLILQIAASFALISDGHTEIMPDVYVGIDISYGDVAEAKAVIDQVSSFTNLIVIGTSKITWYPNKLNETFNYAYNKGLSFISLPPALADRIFNASAQFVTRSEWYAYARSTWGDRLLGFYYLDEPGGRQQDLNRTWTGNLTADGSSYTDAAYRFTETVSLNLEHSRRNATSYKAFTADYSLYWFDYEAGYDTVFAEFGWNYSRQLNVALCRGAATLHNKEWGAIMSWTYTAPPYIESGEELYNDMVLAYENGAKYILVFDGNEGWTGGILKEEHLAAMRRFWDYVQENPGKSNPISDRTAYVLPEAYGFGFRGPEDHIWGLWEADSLSRNVSISVASLLRDYGEKLDIVYEDGLKPGDASGYKQLLYWNAYALPPPRISVMSPENITYDEGNITLTFTVNTPSPWMAYSLDGQEQITCSENATLSNLPEGHHNITFYAKDEFGTLGMSETIFFSVDLSDPFPLVPVCAVIVLVAVMIVGACLLVYLKKRKRQAANALRS